LDDFKSVNDHYGHAAGDQLLKRIVRALMAVIADLGFLVRLAGDEFVVVLNKMPEAAFNDLETALRAAVANAKITVGTLEVSRTASLGFVKLDQKMDVPTAIGLADDALLQAKAAGKNRTQGFDRRARRLTPVLPSVDAVRKALQIGEIGYHVQPIFRADGQEAAGYEALLRWSRASGEVLGPSQFLDTMTKAYNAATRPPLEAARATSQWAVNSKGKYISFNVSEAFMLRIINEGLGWVEDLVGDVPHDKIVFEVLETVFDRQNDYVTKAVCALRSCGIRIALDDFGTGYSSLERLQWLEVDFVKIDKQFVHEAAQSHRGMDIFQSVVDLTRRIGAKSVVEGIETEDHLTLARQSGADLLQGYFLGRPKRIEDY
ncbi:MAG: bifunctional diguanylate cyclase/phosphodiesterase, partial [Octadecabacter sp.]|nr:bifunctional diguanylate cyclase/phosphodiesterase [Octadecabacter sp.]